MDICNILVVEDDPDINKLLCRILEGAGYACRPAYSGTEAALWAGQYDYDLVLLDLMLPGLTGEELIAQLRQRKTMPIIVLSAKTGLEDRVNVLRLGADDFIPKPFDNAEVLARVEAVLRRTTGAAPTSRRLVFDKLVIDMDAFELIVDGKKVDTPPKEMELLYHLASSPNRVYTRNQLLDEVWGFDYFGDSRTVDVHIKRLREKLEGVSTQWELKTVWGVGYKFEVSGA